MLLLLKKEKQMINLASHMAPASGVISALEARPARAASAFETLSASPCRDVFLVDVALADGAAARLRERAKRRNLLMHHDR